MEHLEHLDEITDLGRTESLNLSTLITLIKQRTPFGRLRSPKCGLEINQGSSRRLPRLPTAPRYDAVDNTTSSSVTRLLTLQQPHQPALHPLVGRRTRATSGRTRGKNSQPRGLISLIAQSFPLESAAGGAYLSFLSQRPYIFTASRSARKALAAEGASRGNRFAGKVSRRVNGKVIVIVIIAPRLPRWNNLNPALLLGEE